MLNENGGINTQRIEVASALILYRKKIKILLIVALIVGTLGVIAHLGLSSALQIIDGKTPIWVEVILFVSAPPFVLGLVGTITLARQRSREKKDNCKAQFVFYGDCFFYKFSNTQTIEPMNRKFFYSDAVLKGENENFGYICLLRNSTVLPFSKENLEEKELNAIRKNFGKPAGGETAELKNYKTEEINTINSEGEYL